MAIHQHSGVGGGGDGLKRLGSIGDNVNLLTQFGDDSFGDHLVHGVVFDHQDAT
jgi:hypothetical protein